VRNARKPKTHATGVGVMAECQGTRREASDLVVQLITHENVSLQRTVR